MLPLLKAWFKSQNAPPTPGAVTAPVIGDFASYMVTPTKYENIVWGPKSWQEITAGNAVRTQLMNMWIPASAAPAGGRPVVAWFHANGGDHIIGDGSNMYNNMVAPLLSAGYVVMSFEFPHPVTNKAALGVNWFDAYDDIGRAAQFIRSMAPAFNLNPSRIGAVAQSRGSLVQYACFRPDLADPYGNTYAKRQSSRFSALWLHNGQVMHRSATAAELFVRYEDRAQFLINNPDYPEHLDAIKLVTTADYTPTLMLRNDLPYFGGLQPRTVVEANYLHYPDQFRVMAEAYAARGIGNKVTNVASNGLAAFTGIDAWFQANV